MTNQNEPVLPPRPQGYDAEEGAFASFASRYAPLADELNTASGTNLGGHTTLDGNAFSRVGNEVGLSDAIRNATQRQLDRVNGLAGRTRDMSTAVGNTWVNYVDLDDEAGRRVRRAAGEVT
jgi:hypothetical protein